MINFLLYYLLPFIVIFYGYCQYKFSYWKNRGFLSTSPFNPLGDFYDIGFRYQFMEKFKVIYDEYKHKAKIVGIYMTLSPMLIVNDLDLMRRILVKDFQYFQDRKIFHNEDYEPLTAHLFSIKGEKWRRLRNSLSPTFTSGKMKQMFHIISDKGQNLVQYLSNHIDSKKTFSSEDISQRFTAEVVGSCAFGLECNAFKNTDEPEIVGIAREVFQATPLTAFYFFFVSAYQSPARFLKLRMFSKHSEHYFMNAMKSTFKYREENKVQRNDFFHMLMSLHKRGTIFDDKPENDKEKITFNELAAQAFVFFFAGFETSSTAMNFGMYFLAKYPEIQDKVRDEIKRVKKEHGDKIGYDALMEMHYLHQVFNETLRLFPPIGSTLRAADIDYKIPDTDLVIPKGTMVTIPVYAIHKDPDIYPDPEKFDPDRFTSEECQKRHPYSFLPFGDGPRNCIGMRFAQLQSKFGLAAVVENFVLSLNEKTEEPLRMDPASPNMHAKGGIWLNLRKIQK